MRDAFSNLSFMFQWILSAIFALFATLISFAAIVFGGSLVAMLVTHQHPENLNPNAALMFSLILYSLMGLAFGLIYGSVQKSLLRQKTGEPWRGWLLASAIGGALGMILTLLLLAGQIVTYFQLWVLPPPDALLWIGLQMATIPFGVMAFAQTFVLWRYVHGAWTWVLANLVSGLVIFGLLAAGIFAWATNPLLMIAVVIGLAAAPAIVTGFAILWLINLNWRSEY